MTARGTRPTGPRPWPTAARRQCESMVELAQEIRRLADETRHGDAQTNRYLREVHLADIARLALQIEMDGVSALRDMDTKAT